MSAETPQRPQSQTRASEGPTVVLPQQVTDPTILDSVAGFISDVVPSSYNVPCDSKDQIQWAHFEQLEVDESNFSFDFDCDKISAPPLLLVLGYTAGVQVWAIPSNGEAVEILSWRIGTVRVLKFLPAPYKLGCNSSSDHFAEQRPLIALCDSAAPGPQFCSLSFISLKSGEQVKLFKFKNPVIDVLANRRSIVVAFTEKFAIFDAFTLEDRMTVTSCYLSPGINANPIALGTKWLAYAENKLIPSKKSGGGNEGEGVQSYTATMIYAAKSFGRGLRELGETVASSLTGNAPYKPATLSSSAPHCTSSQGDGVQKGIVSIINIENQTTESESTQQTDNFVAHFIAHTEAIVQLLFDPSGMLLLTADKRGHDFHLFKIHPHPLNPALSSVHHLYILHRGDTTSKVQNMCFSPDSRWVTVSTLRGTTHVFPVTPYGGNVGTRTHATPHVVNRMSRFHRSAGLTSEGRSNSPVSQNEMPVNSSLPYQNPRLPPYPHPTVVHALAQIRQPVYIQNSTNAQRQNTEIACTSSGSNKRRQRLSSSSEDNMHVALRVAAAFAPPRAWIDIPTQQREATHTKTQIKPVESLFIMSCHGSLIQYDLDPHSLNVPKEKLCDDTPIELTVVAKAQWVLQRQPHGVELHLPMSPTNLSLFYQEVSIHKPKSVETDDKWLSQVEIVTHAGPHRRLWMGPQFTFKTYSNTSGAALSILESQAIDIGKTKPVNMPANNAYPVLIECGSLSSCEPSPKLIDMYQQHFDDSTGAGETQLKEDLAEAMLESPGVRDRGGRCVIVAMKPHSSGIAKVVNPLGTVVTVHSDDESDVEVFEDAVIHENCDEALFRPVVASKAVVLADPKKVSPLPAHRTTILEPKKTQSHTTKDNFDKLSNLLNSCGKKVVDKTTSNVYISKATSSASAGVYKEPSPKSLQIIDDVFVKEEIKPTKSNNTTKKCEETVKNKISTESPNIQIKPNIKESQPQPQSSALNVLNKPKTVSTVSNKVKETNKSVSLISDFKINKSSDDTYKSKISCSSSSKVAKASCDVNVNVKKVMPIVKYEYEKHDLVMVENSISESFPKFEKLCKPSQATFSDPLSDFRLISPPPPLDNSLININTSDLFVFTGKDSFVNEQHDKNKKPTKKTPVTTKNEVSSLTLPNKISSLEKDDIDFIDDVEIIMKESDNPKISNSNTTRNIDKYQGLDSSDVASSSPDEKLLIDEKLMSKKKRKPKTKLGVRISKEPNENDNSLKFEPPNESPKIAVAVAATFTTDEDSIIICEEPKKPSWSEIAASKNHSKIIDQDWPKDDGDDDEINLIKIGENSSSQTESDDSTKIPVVHNEDIVNAEEDALQEITKPENASKMIKKKSKKKRR